MFPTLRNCQVVMVLTFSSFQTLFTTTCVWSFLPVGHKLEQSLPDLPCDLCLKCKSTVLLFGSFLLEVPIARVFSLSTTSATLLRPWTSGCADIYFCRCVRRTPYVQIRNTKATVVTSMRLNFIILFAPAWPNLQIWLKVVSFKVWRMLSYIFFQWCSWKFKWIPGVFGRPP